MMHYSFKTSLIAAVMLSGMTTMLVHAQNRPIEDVATVNHANPNIRFGRVESLLRESFVAAKQVNYFGTFTYEFGERMETVEVIHRAHGGKETQLVKHLNGAPRAFTVLDQPQNCMSLGGHLYSGAQLSTQLGKTQLADSYHLSIAGEERIANRPAVIVEAMPRDRYRYGMSMALDKQTLLPLRVMIINRKKQAMERFQFVTLKTYTTLPAYLMAKLEDVPHAAKNQAANELCHVRASSSSSELADDVDTDPELAPAQLQDEEVATDSTERLAGQSKQQLKEIPKNTDQAAKSDSQAYVESNGHLSWRPTWLPKGFVLSQISKKEDGQTVLTYSDGIGSFSLFIDMAVNTPTPTGIAHRGASLALIKQLAANQRAVLVGEVPAVTASQVVASLVQVSRVDENLVD